MDATDDICLLYLNMNEYYIFISMWYCLLLLLLLRVLWPLYGWIFDCCAGWWLHKTICICVQFMIKKKRKEEVVEKWRKTIKRHNSSQLGMFIRRLASKAYAEVGEKAIRNIYYKLLHILFFFAICHFYAKREDAKNSTVRLYTTELYSPNGGGNVQRPPKWGTLDATCGKINNFKGHIINKLCIQY